MTTGYYLQDYPNPTFGQYGWPRTKVSGAIGVHTAENNTDFDGPDPGAEDVARFIGRRTDPGSYHALADADSRIKLVHPRYAAWADTTNNAHAMSVSGAMQAARWAELTPARAAALTRNMAYAAAELVQDALAAGLLSAPVPARRITPAEAIAGTRAGFYGHGETNPGRRYDPGQNFGWTLFLSTYASTIGGGIAAMGTITQPQEEPLVPNEADKVFWPIEGSEKVSLNELLNSIDRKSSAANTKVDLLLEAIGGVVKFTAIDGSTVTLAEQLRSLDDKAERERAENAALRAAVAKLTTDSGVSPEQIDAAIKAALAGISITLTAGGN